MSRFGALFRYSLFVIRYSRLTAIVFLALISCGVEQTSFTSNIFHNTTAHFNGYFYAREKAAEVEKTILKSLDDDHNLILRLYPKLDTVLAKSYQKDTDEIIKMASISIQRHPNSRWVYENYILVGRARMYDGEFVDAIQTFKYVNTKSRSATLRHQALIYLVRTFTEHEEFEKAEEAFMFLEKENLSKVNAKNLYLEKAYYYQVRSDYDKMVRNLTRADSLLTNSDRKARIYFIIGQVYQQLGFGAEAYNYYRKVLSANPEYEIDFYARLNMAQVARLDNQRDVKTIRKQFQKLLDDTKNAEFKDKIYYELGEFERKQNHLPEAIDDYKLAAHAGKNKRIQGMAFLRVGQLNFDSLKKYDQAKLYYDSAVQSLPKEFENYAGIKVRQEVLGDFAKYNETIRWQDSLLNMAAIDTAVLRKTLDSALTKRLVKDDTKKKKRRFGIGGGGGGGGGGLLNVAENTATSNWYFDNPSAVASGQTEFQRIWGNVGLEDNWRRSNKAAVQTLPGDNVAEAPTDASGDPKQVVAAVDPKVAEINKVFSELPVTAEQKATALGKIEEAYFQLGDLYFIKLNEKANAATSYQKLIERFPASEHTPEVLYKLYLIEKEKTDGDPDKYSRLLTTNYPHSTFTRVLLNPDYMKETSVTTEKQKLIYKEAYEAYRTGNLREAQEKTQSAIALGETGFTSQLELLRILIMGKTEDVSMYQAELERYMEKYTDGPMKIYAQTLLDASKTFLQKVEKSKGIRFANEPDAPHYVVVLYRIEDKIANTITGDIEQFNASNYRNKKLETSYLVFNDDNALTMVTELKDKVNATEYFDKLSSWLAQRPSLTSYKFDIFVITKDNFQIFYRTKALDEYLTFYDRNYKIQNQ
ncbi:MAG TPA: tetratricopeptide repeat protein [Cyclobacteriaceae bacterium]|nr:tetratricopeptide repeat protein [Cyclobacteriaceae bacterium]